MKRQLGFDFVRVTETAALAAAPWMGKGCKKCVDQSAVDTMRRVFDTIGINGTVVIGEGEKDEAPQLYIGETIGDGSAKPQVDIAVDPVEGTTLVSKGLPNALAVVVVSDRHSLLQAPDTYMEKIAVGPQAKGKINLDASVEDNLRSVAAAVNKSIKDLTIVVLDRPRHEKLINDIRTIGARIKLISDGDVAGGIATGLSDSGVDMMMGIGGATEGVLTAAALKCMGGEIQARLKPRHKQDREKAKELGIDNIDKLYFTDDMAQGDDIIFAATAITDGDLLEGIRYSCNSATSHTMLLRSKTGTLRFIKTYHTITRKPDYFPKDIFNPDFSSMIDKHS
jgi:fructose-1,6-bisphosphatase II